MPAKYKAADLDEVVRACEYLDSNEQQQLLALLTKYKHLFDGTLGTWNNEPYDIELKARAMPYHSRPFPIPKIHERTLKKSSLRDLLAMECNRTLLQSNMH
jgi:hypothetical protein